MDTNLTAVELNNAIIDQTNLIIEKLKQLEGTIVELAVKPEINGLQQDYADHLFWCRTSNNWLKTIGQFAIDTKVGLNMNEAANNLVAANEAARNDLPIQPGQTIISHTTFGSFDITACTKGKEYKVMEVDEKYFYFRDDQGTIQFFSFDKIGHLFSIK